MISPDRICLIKEIIEMILNCGMPARKDTGNNSLLLLTSIRDSVIENTTFLSLR